MEVPKKIHIVTDHKTHQLIGIFDKEHSDKFFTGTDVLIGGKVIKGGLKFTKDEYVIWNIELNKEFTDSRIRVSNSKSSTKKEGF